MSRSISYCKLCDIFTLNNSCSCGSKVFTTKPAKFSISDKWGKYRRIAKKMSKDL